MKFKGIETPEEVLLVWEFYLAERIRAIYNQDKEAYERYVELIISLLEDYPHLAKKEWIK